MNKTPSSIVRLLLTVSLGCLLSCEPNPSSSESLATSAAFLDQIAAEFAPLPMAIDEETELVAVDAQPARLVYSYRLVDLEASEIDAYDLLRRFQPGAAQVACNDPGTRDTLLSKGVTLRYAYLDKNLTLIASFDVTEATCDF